MNQGLVESLSALARAAIRGREDVRASGLGLDHVHLANLQKLAYFGLIRPHYAGPGDRKRGRWHVTTLGFDFLDAKATVSRIAVTYRGETIRFEGEPVMVGDVLPGYQFVRDYAEEASPIGRGIGPAQLALALGGTPSALGPEKGNR
jgi:hypothetical protein